MPLHPAARSVADSILRGESVVFVVGSWPSYAESGVPGVDSIKDAVWSVLADHVPDFGEALKDENVLKKGLWMLPFEAMFALAGDSATLPLRDTLIPVYEMGRPGPFHKLMAWVVERFPNVEILTTNFDTLIEQSCSSPIDVAYLPTHFAERFRRPLWKIHGTVGHLDPGMRSIVYTLRQTSRGLSAPCRSWLRSRATAARFVYVGYGANDLDLFPVLRDTARDDAHDVWCIRPIKPYETTDTYENSDDTQRPRELARLRGGELHCDGYERFCEDLAGCLGGAYVYWKDPDPPDWGHLVAPLRSACYEDTARIYAGELMIHLGFPRWARRIVISGSVSETAAIVLLGRSAFVAGRLATAQRIFRKAALRSLRERRGGAMLAGLLSNMSECAGNRWKPFVALALSTAAVWIGQLSAREDGGEAAAWARLRRSQGFRQWYRATRFLLRSTRLSRVFPEGWSLVNRLRRRDLAIARSTMVRVGNSYGIESVRRNLGRVDDRGEASFLVRRNLAAADRFTWIGRHLEAVFSYREIAALCAKCGPGTLFRWKGREWSPRELSLALTKDAMDTSEHAGAWTPLLKASMDMALLCDDDGEKVCALQTAAGAIAAAELGIYGWLQRFRIVRALKSIQDRI